MSTHELARQVAAMRTEIREVRRVQDQILARLEARDGPYSAPTTTDDGGLFLPGTGTLGRHELSPDAQAALAELEARDALEQETRP